MSQLQSTRNELITASKTEYSEFYTNDRGYFLEQNNCKSKSREPSD